MAYYKCGKIFATQNSNTSIETASGAIANFRTSLSMPVLGCIAEFSASQASGTPTPVSPIPIVGVDKVNVACCGKNLADVEGATSISAQTTLGTIELPAGSYTMSANCKNNGSITCYLTLRQGSATKALITINDNENTRKSIAFTLTEKATYSFVCSGASAGYNFDISDIQIEFGSTATEYEPYNGTTALINLGGTYYGGSVDAVTGKITLTHGVADMGELKWTYSTAREWFYDYSLDIVSGSLDILSPIYEVKTVAELVNDLTLDNAITVNNNSVVVRNLAYTDANTFKTAMDGIILVYPLATPIVVYASNTAELYTKAGLNNIFCDTGDIEVKYRKLHSDN